jgi:mxaJ protein
MYSLCRDYLVRCHTLTCWLSGSLLVLVALIPTGTSRAADDSDAAKFCDCGGSSQTKEKSPGKEAAGAATKRRILRVAADPNNLPLSNDRREGFENKLAELLAKELNADLQYVWHAQRRGFFRETMTQGDCDLAMSAPTHFERALTTRPYYRSSYMFVTRKDRNLKIASLDDPQLRKLQIGVQVIGDDGVNTPPAHALAARGIIDNVVGYTVYGDYSQPNPTARIIEAVANGDVDLAIAWGPLAGYFAPRQQVPLELVPLTGTDARSSMTFTFDIGVGVRKGNAQLCDEVSRLFEKRQADVKAILDSYGVPRIPSAESADKAQP